MSQATPFGRRSATTALLAGLTLAAAACGGRHHLADYDFSTGTLAVVYFGAPSPEVHTGGVAVEGETPLEVVLSAGGRAAREVEARRARARMDSAATRVDMAERMADRTLERASRYLGARPVDPDQGPDFLLEIDIHRFGLDARQHGGRVFVFGEAFLLDAATGREIWHVDVGGSERLTPSVSGESDVVEDVLTAGSLTAITVAGFERFLEALADFTADRIARELREDLRDVRR